jgi:hypothetical protein
MVELKIEIPDELESEFRQISKIDLSILVSKALKGELSRIVKFKRIVSKSKLKPDQAERLSDKISDSLARRYDRLSRG